MTGISLQAVANQLSRWEVPILQALYRRCGAAVSEGGGELLLRALAADEQGLSEVKRRQVAYRPFFLPWGWGLSSSDPLLWSAASVNLNEILLQRYRELSRELPRVAAAEQVSDWQAERELLPRVSYRVHYGAVYVAECKYLDDEAGWRRLVRLDDREEMMRRLTRADVERQLLRRVSTLGDRLGGEEFARAGESLYRELIIPLTKEGEIAYLLRRTRC